MSDEVEQQPSDAAVAAFQALKRAATHADSDPEHKALFEAVGLHTAALSRDELRRVVRMLVLRISVLTLAVDMVTATAERIAGVGPTDRINAVLRELDDTQ